MHRPAILTAYVALVCSASVCLSGCGSADRQMASRSEAPANTEAAPQAHLSPPASDGQFTTAAPLSDGSAGSETPVLSSESPLPSAGPALGPSSTKAVQELPTAESQFPAAAGDQDRSGGFRQRSSAGNSSGGHVVFTEQLSESAGPISKTRSSSSASSYKKYGTPRKEQAVPEQPASASAEPSSPGGSDSTVVENTQTPAASPNGEDSVQRQERIEVKEAGAESVDLFFATDRLPTEQLIPSVMQVFAPAGVIGMLCCAMVIGFSVARRWQGAWLVSCAGATCLTIIVLHTCIIRWQQYSRLARNAETQFSVSRYESSGGYPLHLGTAHVSLPADHKKGQVESPKAWKWEFVETTKKHVVLHSLSLIEDQDRWYREVSSKNQATDGSEAFVFIHGFNVRFADALKRTAQLSHDLEITGPTICYSWPSRGQVAAYTVDEATVSWSAPHFERLILDLRKKTSCKSINIIAHSMGNRALLEALERISLSTRGQTDVPKVIDQLVMAAPDVDVKKFESRYADVARQLANRTTLYFSDADRALQLSRVVHGAGRLGLSGSRHANVGNIEAVNIGRQNFFALGHSYYGSSPEVIDDLHELLHDKRPASDRMLLRRVATNDNTYWKIDRTMTARRQRSLNR